MPLIPHTFDHERHIYQVPGEFVMATSDVLTLNGLCLFQGVPPSVLERASNRGTELHAAVCAYEEGKQIPPMVDEAYERFMAYLRWSEAVGFRCAGPCERPIVYQHEGTDQLIGATPDLMGFIGDDLYLVDLKTCFRQSGQAKKQKLFEWRLQTQSYKEGLLQDEELWETWGPCEMKRMVLHLHPDCGIVERGGKRLGWEQHLFPWDDSDLWNAAVLMAAAKLAHGHKWPERE